MRFSLKTALLVGLLSAPASWAATQDEPTSKSDRRPRAMREPTERARRAGPDRRGPKATPWKEMSETDRKAVTNFMHEHFPRMEVEMDRLKAEAPLRYERRMERVAPEMRRLMAAKEKDPRRASVLIRERQMGLQLQQMATDYHAADDESAKERIRKSIRELASEEFDTRRERRNQEVRQLETKLDELKSRLAEMESVRDEMLDKRTREILERGQRENDKSDDRRLKRGKLAPGGEKSE